MRRIALLVNSTRRGGAERVAATLCNAWAARGDQVVLIPTYLPAESQDYPLHADVRVAPLRDLTTRRAGVAGTIAKVRALRHLVRAVDPHVVVSFLTNVNITALVALAGMRAPLVVSERVDPAADIELPRALRMARYALYQFADAFVAQTAEAAARYRARMLRPPRTVVIPNPLPAALRESSLRASSICASSGEIVAIGRLTPQKQFDALIDAFAQAFPVESPWRLSIWGDGPLRAPLQALIDERGLRERVRLRGSTSDPWGVLAGAQICALTSLYEGFPNTMLEAMAIGVPCVSFDCPSGPRELALDGEVAVLVRNGDRRALAEALRGLAADPERRARIGAAGAESVRTRFAESVVLTAWDELFGRLCG